VSLPQFGDFFQAATEKSAPYGYQCRLARGPAADPDEPDTLRGGTACCSQLINIPTGLGKTAAVVLAWLWNRVAHPDAAHRQTWPSRLVYCLPMRTLVEQTQTEVQKWLENVMAKSAKIGIKGQPGEDLKWLTEHSPIILMGGEEPAKKKREWDIHPERPAILIGTQDMLLSRALNRGYGMSRYRWPMHFGLLNNDCLWVMDETQLMGVGVETSAQLDGFRHDGKMPTFGVCPTWWMSATLDETETRLATVDHKSAAGWPIEKLSAAEQSSGRPHELITATKKLSRATLKNAPALLTLNTTTENGYAKQLAELVAERHRALLEKPHPSGTLTLVVVNRVLRAREIFQALKNSLYDPVKVALIHSRFRPIDRERHTKLLFGTGDRIVIATQAVEAGVDVSARLLITELAPWSSLVQRMGRCNRRADISDAEVLWVDIEPDAKGELLLPYSNDELAKAREALGNLTNASPNSLVSVSVQEMPVVRPVIRRRDLVDLFDTTPDICGQDLDVSRYIRDGDDNDVQLFWRNLADNSPTENEPQPHHGELCRVAIGEAREFFKKAAKSFKKDKVWRWNFLEKKWQPEKLPRPGGVYLVDVICGGYEDDLGWTGELKVKKLTIHRPVDEAGESYDANQSSFARSPQTIAEHTQHVVEETVGVTNAVTLVSEFAATLRTAALWHDIGKAHDEFQKMLRNGAAARDGQFWAKSANKDGKCERYGFRHELASALAWLLADTPHATGRPGSRERDLVAYLIAAHHGKVRLSIRSLPDETGDGKNPNRLFARGILDGEKLKPVPLGEFTTPEITLDLGFMKMGEGEHGPSWLARTVALRDRIDLGPFRLAYLETLLRAADARASREATT